MLFPLDYQDSCSALPLIGTGDLLGRESVEAEDMMAAIYGRVSSVFLDGCGVLTGRNAFRYDPSVSFA